jgi:hypothetical protein
MNKNQPDQVRECHLQIVRSEFAENRGNVWTFASRTTKKSMNSGMCPFVQKKSTQNQHPTLGTVTAVLMALCSQYCPFAVVGEPNIAMTIVSLPHILHD